MNPRSQSAVIVPLYQYPLTERTWEPLHNAISTHPSLTFVIIINPNSGPGVNPDGWLPDASYIREIPRFTSQPNVIVVGYVRLDYCRRQLAEIEEDIVKYGHWAGSGSNSNGEGEVNLKPRGYGGSSGLGVQGIFFDEAPNLFDEHTAAYLDTVGRMANATDGILGDRLIIHNPGTVPDPAYTLYWQNKQAQSLAPRVPPLPPRNTTRKPFSFTSLSRDSSRSRSPKPDAPADRSTPTPTTVQHNARRGAPDITTVFEASYALYQDKQVQMRLSNLLRHGRQQCCYMVHSVPLDLITDVTVQLRGKGMYIFVTDLRENYYETFGKSWEAFIEAMAR